MATRLKNLKISKFVKHSNCVFCKYDITFGIWEDDKEDYCKMKSSKYRHYKGNCNYFKSDKYSYKKCEHCKKESWIKKTDKYCGTCKGKLCFECNKVVVDDYKPEYCCSGKSIEYPCGCMGLPTNPEECICEECFGKLSNTQREHQSIDVDNIQLPF